MTLAEIYADTENLPKGVEPIILNGESFAHWEVVTEFARMSVTLWCTRAVMIQIHFDRTDPYPSSVATLTAEQATWLGSLPNMLG